MLANASASINQMRRDLLRPQRQKKFQTLCSKVPTGTSQFLLGDNFTDKIKVASQGSRLGKQQFKFFNNHRGNGRYQPYGGYSGYSGYNSGYSENRGRPWNPYGQRMPFLGKWNTITKRRYSKVWKLREKSESRMVKELHSEDEWSDYEQNNEERSFLYRPEQLAEERQWPKQGTPQRQVRQMSQEVGELFQSNWLVFKAGRISQCAHKWAEITSDIHILKAVRGFHIDFMCEDGDYTGHLMPHSI